ncbi:hypothetical protein J1614_003150 [Plenodomus biglobosus]|nr:hypothetical protein J1614_003150 [Plenodomus biglobosus]
MSSDSSLAPLPIVYAVEARPSIWSLGATSGEYSCKSIALQLLEVRYSIGSWRHRLFDLPGRCLPTNASEEEMQQPSERNGDKIAD